MQTILLNSNSKSDIKLLLDLAKKIGMKSNVLNESEMEEIGLINAIKNGRTNQLIDANDFIQKLRK
ncbi:MAG: hypothetical protein SFY32_09195 [Bacteroidota bacterium]|nr:hypothetical protein [Bacteroidota bacterium]